MQCACTVGPLGFSSSGPLNCAAFAPDLYRAASAARQSPEPRLIKPRTPPGVMELLPRDQIAFQRMLDTIRRNFERFGFLPVETPVMELSEVLLTKSGGETERQVYFVQSTGALGKSPRAAGEATPELALRFDLTVPLARYVAEHEHELAFPFRRYQMQRVYRGERAQRGRFREFYQCDIDVIGKDALSSRFDAEIPAVIHAVFSRAGDRRLHHPAQQPQAAARLLRGAGRRRRRAAGAGAARGRQARQARRGRTCATTLAGEGFGLSAEAVDRIMAFVAGAFDLARRCAGASSTRLGEGNDAVRAKAWPSCAKCCELVRALGVPESRYALNFSIARGLDYYTGTVYETTLDDYPQIGSICSGGRYENLASHYTKSKLPGVGISIGLTRLFCQLREAGLLGDRRQHGARCWSTLMDDGAPAACLALSQRPARGRLQHRSAAGADASWPSSSSTPTAPASASWSMLRRGRNRAGRGHGQGPAPRGPVRGAAIELASTLRVELAQAAGTAGAPHA